MNWGWGVDGVVGGWMGVDRKWMEGGWVVGIGSGLGLLDKGLEGS